MAQLLEAPYSYFADANGAPLSGGKVFTYTAGTLTPKAAYTDSTAGTPLANPVILDSAGRAQIWLVGSYKIIVKDSLDNTISTTDNIISTTGAPFSDSSAIIANAADPTKKLIISTASITSGATRTWTAPDADLTVVGTDVSQTLTNKIINTIASTTSAAGLNVPHGVAPTSPVNGDIWTTTAAAFLRLNGTTIPLSTAFKVGNFTFDVSTATGTIVTTGVGFQPRLLILIHAINATAACSIGFGNGTSQFHIAQNDGGTADNWTTGTTLIAQSLVSGSAYQQYALNSLDADGFTLGNTKTSTPTGTARFGYIAIR